MSRRLDDFRSTQVEALRSDPELLEKAGSDREKAIVVAADDDHEWEPFALATLLHVGFSSSKPVGYDATKTVWTYYSYFYPRGRPIKDSVCVAQAGDMLAAPLSLFGELERSAAGVLYSSLLRHRRDPSRADGAASCSRAAACRAASSSTTSSSAPTRRTTVRPSTRTRGGVGSSARRSGGSGRASPRSSPARRAAARRKRCS